MAPDDIVTPVISVGGGVRYETATGQNQEMLERLAFERQAQHVRIVTEAFLTEWYGERCEDYEKHCEICKRWRWLDKIVENL